VVFVIIFVVCLVLGLIIRCYRAERRREQYERCKFPALFYYTTMIAQPSLNHRSSILFIQVTNDVSTMVAAKMQQQNYGQKSVSTRGKSKSLSTTM
jgi:hypothetical protein